jgi:S-adenosylmethionine/arginine decarboxylase-like enzyme
MYTTNKHWGQEILVDCSDCNPESIRSLENINKFIDELIEKTEMKKWGNLHALRLEDDEYNREHDIVGYSVCQFIQTSSIVGHFCETSNSMYLDFFSCKHFNQVDVLQLVEKYFSPKKLRDITVMRDAGHLVAIQN